MRHLLNTNLCARYQVLLLVIGLMATSGCTSKPSGYPDTAQVEGTITLDGAPLEGAKVTFSPAKGRASKGTTDAAGKYVLRYTGTIDGAMLGTHSVSVIKEVPDPRYKAPKKRPVKEGELDPGEPEVPKINIIPRKYQGRNSELTAQVKDELNVFNFDLKSK